MGVSASSWNKLKQVHFPSVVAWYIFCLSLKWAMNIHSIKIEGSQQESQGMSIWKVSSFFLAKRGFNGKKTFAVRGTGSGGMLAAPTSGTELLSVIIACSDQDSFLGPLEEPLAAAISEEWKGWAKSQPSLAGASTLTSQEIISFEGT